MYRSGSTFLYNAIRVLLRHAGADVWGGGTEAFIATTGEEADVYVVKEHRYIETLASYSDEVYVSTRNPKDAWLSMRRFMNARGEPLPEFKDSREWVSWFNKWKPLAKYTLFFDDLVEEDGEWNALKDLNHLLGTDVKLKHVLRSLRSELAPPEEGKNPDTLVFADHYTGRDYHEDVKPKLRIPDRDKKAHA